MLPSCWDLQSEQTQLEEGRDKMGVQNFDQNITQGNPNPELRVCWKLKITVGLYVF